MRHRAGAVAAMRLGGGAQDREFARGLVRIGEKGRGQRPRRAQLRQQQLDALWFGEGGVIETRLNEAKHFANHPLVHFGILTQV